MNCQTRKEFEVTDNASCYLEEPSEDVNQIVNSIFNNISIGGHIYNAVNKQLPVVIGDF